MAGFALRSSSMRRTETPNAVMTTLASPTQGPTDQLSIWRVEMRAGQRGPRHVFDSEQVWHVLAGELDVTIGGQKHRKLVAESSCHRLILARPWPYRQLHVLYRQLG